MKQVSGAELIALFIRTHCFDKAFVVTGGACAFMIDAVGRDTQIDYIAFQHEQAAAMAADAVWRINRRVGVSIATSGPGATNLITGIACSWFDSIPSIHITGQVNQRESALWNGWNVRQAGFQETDIVAICSPVTKSAMRVRSTDELSEVLMSSLKIATTGRMGPVLIDIPMDVQQAPCSRESVERILNAATDSVDKSSTSHNLSSTSGVNLFSGSQRPLVVLGGGLVSAGTMAIAQEWCERSEIPYCSSWAAMPHIDRSADGYLGSLGVYGSRLTNWAVQSADAILCLGTRLDNRQRTSNPKGFAPFARLHIVDVDLGELRKFFGEERYTTEHADLSNVRGILERMSGWSATSVWIAEIQKTRMQISSGFGESVKPGGLNPYEVVQSIQKCVSDNAIFVSDCGANLCWVYQAFLPSGQTLFTAGGNSPMGYSLPAAIGASFADEDDRPVICLIGDGGMQMNIQELQTISGYNLNIKVVVLNNFGYGIIKQFQDAYFEGRHEASGRGYSLPDFSRIAEAYGLRYHRVTSLEDLSEELFMDGAALIDIHIPSDALITPKVEMDRFIHDQFPYDESSSTRSPLFNYPDRPSQLA